MIEREYPCEDGTLLKVRFADEAQATVTYRLDRSHARDPRTPMGDALDRLAVAGGKRAYEETGLELPPSWEPGPDAQGFPYWSEAPIPPEVFARMQEGCGALVQRHGSALGIWTDLCRPGSQRSWAELEDAPDTAPLAELAEAQGYGFHLTMIPAYVCGNDLQLLASAVEPLFGDESRLVAHELAQGFDNPTLEADQRLWEVGRLALDEDDVVAALQSEDAATAMSALRRDGAAATFFAAVDAFLDEFGMRAEGWDIACPTWREQRAGFWAQVAQMASASAPEPRAILGAAAERRRSLVEDITARLAGDEAALGRFQRRLARIEPYVLVREDRALWQVALVGALRSAVLRQGDRLVREGRVDAREDVLFLEPDEVASAGHGALRDVVARRRAEHERWCRVVPPMVIGGPEPAPSPSLDTPQELRGIGASRGVATGTARVIVDLDDADRLEPGDILVCVMTSPPWTPLFGLAGAVVVDTGDLGSHPAIAAREYGVPCVLGVEGATRRIPDGATVRVDGAAGTVTLE